MREGNGVFFLNGAECSLISVNSGNLINHSSMNWAEFKDPVSHVHLAGTVVASWSLTKDVAGSSPFTVTTNIYVKTFRKNSNVFTELPRRVVGILLAFFLVADINAPMDLLFDVTEMKRLKTDY